MWKGLWNVLLNKTYKNSWLYGHQKGNVRTWKLQCHCVQTKFKHLRCTKVQSISLYILKNCTLNTQQCIHSIFLCHKKLSWPAAGVQMFYGTFLSKSYQLVWLVWGSLVCTLGLFEFSLGQKVSFYILRIWKTFSPSQ